MYAFLFLSIRLRGFLSLLPLAPPIEPGTRWPNLRDILHLGEFVVKYVQTIDTYLNRKKTICSLYEELNIFTITWQPVSVIYNNILRF